MKNRYLSVMLGCLAVGTAGLARAEAPKADLTSAAKTYASKCASCHGKDGKGNPAMAKVFKVEAASLDLLTDASLAKTDEELIAITADGKGKMPGYKGKISPEETAALITYIRSLKK